MIVIIKQKIVRDRLFKELFANAANVKMCRRFLALD